MGQIKRLSEIKTFSTVLSLPPPPTFLVQIWRAGPLDRFFRHHHQSGLHQEQQSLCEPFMSETVGMSVTEFFTRSSARSGPPLYVLESAFGCERKPSSVNEAARLTPITSPRPHTVCPVHPSSSLDPCCAEKQDEGWNGVCCGEEMRKTGQSTKEKNTGCLIVARICSDP